MRFWQVSKIFMIFYVFFLDPESRDLFISGLGFFITILADFILIFTASEIAEAIKLLTLYRFLQRLRLARQSRN